MTKPRVLSGVQPTGNLHLGNYLGAIRNWVGMQDSHECLFMLADLHAITVPQNPADLARNTRETAAAFIASGIDPKRSAIFPQSAVTMHSELAWILNCHTPLGWLNRMTQFKEKAKITQTHSSAYDKAIKNGAKLLKMLSEKIAETNSEKLTNFDENSEFREFINNLKTLKEIETDPSKIQTINEFIIKGEQIQIRQDNLDKKIYGLNAQAMSSILEFAEEIQQLLSARAKNEKDASKILEAAQLGLYAYPVLMAADIIGYHATHVPVGEDQKQHLELARDIAGAFNRAYEEEFFPLPEPLIMPTAARIMSLTDGTKKMSKSDPSDYSRITLMDDADAIAKKIKKAQTDSEPSLSYDPKGRPSVANLISIYAALVGSTPEAVVTQFADLKTGAFKGALADLAVEKLAPITARMRELMADTTTLDGILRQGSERARAIAAPIHEETMKRVGFLRV
jgi:tryptophanyl-tRNA synthetase